MLTSRFGVAAVVFLALGPVLLFAGRANAADDIAAARAHFGEAQKRFAVGEFAAAGEEYLQAYKAKPDPAFLYNAAQAYRAANQLDRAVVLYKNYLQFFPNESNAEAVRGQIAKLKEAIAATEKAKAAPPTEVTTPRPGAETAPVATHEPEKPTAAVAPPAPIAVEKKAERAPVYKQWWLWTVVGVVVAGAAVGVAVALTVPSHPWANGPAIGPGTQALTAEVRW